jgi:hypothetical protein
MTTASHNGQECPPCQRQGPFFVENDIKCGEDAIQIGRMKREDMRERRHAAVRDERIL